jgi:hypothetical protein
VTVEMEVDQPTVATFEVFVSRLDVDAAVVAEMQDATPEIVLEQAMEERGA